MGEELGTEGWRETRETRGTRGESGSTIRTRRVTFLNWSSMVTRIPAMFGRWLPAACLLVACGSRKSDVAPQDTSGADVQDVDKVSDVARPDTSMDTEVT